MDAVGNNLGGGILAKRPDAQVLEEQHRHLQRTLWAFSLDTTPSFCLFTYI